MMSWRCCATTCPPARSTMGEKPSGPSTLLQSTRASMLLTAASDGRHNCAISMSTSESGATNGHRAHGEETSAVLASCQIVLCVFVFFVFLFLSSIHQSRWCAAPNAHCKCGAQWLLDIYTVPVASGRLTVEKASGTRRAPASPRKHLRPRYPRKATAPPYAAAIQILGREPDPPKSGSSSPSALAVLLDLLRAARVPLQPSNCCLHLLE